MHGRRVMKTIQRKPLSRFGADVIFLTAFFFFGSYVGFRFSVSCDSAALAAYLRDFCSVMESGGAEHSFLRSAILYFGYVLVICLFGFSPVGLLLIPGVFAVFGFSVMYTISCFVRVFARPGIWPAAALMVPRLFFSLPVFLIIACEVLSRTVSPVSGSSPKTVRGGGTLQKKQQFLLVMFCVLFLVLGICCERVTAPWLFRLAMERFF